MLGLIAFLFFWSPAHQEKPLPELKSFIAEFRKTLQSDDKLLGQYTYTLREQEIALDSKGKAKKTETKVYQVIRGVEEWQTYRRLISKNDIPTSDKELAKQDREEKERVEKELRKREGNSESRRASEKAKADREEQETMDDVFDMYDIQMVKREAIGGHDTILLTFKARPTYKPKTGDAKILRKIAGRAWVSESDHELVKLEAEVVDAISIGAGILAKVQKGSMLKFERRKVNDEIWLPVRVEATVNGRMLLLKGINSRSVAEYSDHKKYTVDTILKFGDPVKKPPPLN